MTNIIGIDHICITSKNILEDSKIFEQYGYKIDFNEENVKIREEKKEFLKNSNELHNFALLKSINSVAIELIDHKKFNNKNQIYDILFDTKNRSDKNYVKSQEKLLQKLEIIFNKKISKNENVMFNFYENHASVDEINAIIIKSSDLEKSKKFWCDLFGFIEKSSNNNEDYKILEFKSPIKNWNVKFVLIKYTSEKKMRFLNDYGCTCMSFLVTKIEDFLEKFHEFGLKSDGKPYETIINNKKIRLIFLRGLENEIIELIEFRKNE